jgi:tetratricopeptide (TPR) repeat protein
MFIKIITFTSNYRFVMRLKLLILLLFPLTVFSNSKTDSLYSLLSRVSDNEKKREILLELSADSKVESIKKSIKYALQALKYTEVKDNASHARIFKQAGNGYHISGVLDSAMFYYEKSLECFRKSGDSVGVSKILNNMGLIYKTTASFEKALSCYSS